MCARSFRINVTSFQEKMPYKKVRVIMYKLWVMYLFKASKLSSLTTHPGPIAYECCRFLSTVCIRGMKHKGPIENVTHFYFLSLSPKNNKKIVRGR